MPTRRATKAVRIASGRGGSAPNESDLSESAAVVLVHALYRRGFTIAEEQRARLAELTRHRPEDAAPLARSFLRLLKTHARGLQTWRDDVLDELATMPVVLGGAPGTGACDDERIARLVVRSFGHLLTEHAESLRDWYRDSAVEFGRPGASSSSSSRAETEREDGAR